MLRSLALPTLVSLVILAHDLAKLRTAGELSKLLGELLGSKPSEVVIELERAGTTQTLRFELGS